MANPFPADDDVSQLSPWINRCILALNFLCFLCLSEESYCLHHQYLELENDNDMIGLALCYYLCMCVTGGGSGGAGSGGTKHHQSR